LADEHAYLCGTPLLGKQAPVLLGQSVNNIPVAISVFPDELYQGSVPEAVLLQPGRQGRTLRRVAGAEAVLQ